MIARLIFIGSIGWLLSSCSNNRVEPIVGQAPYFKLNQWLSKESEQLKANEPTIHRVLQTDQSIAEAPTDSNNWEDWFKPLSECDLSKPAYHGFYQVDTLIAADTSLIIYQALKPEAVVRLLHIALVEDQVVMIKAKKIVDNLLYRSEANLLYHTDSLYEVDYVQETKFFDQHHFRATYTLLKKK